MKSSISTIVYAIILFVLLNLVSNRLFVRYDFTEGQVYTLSDATSRIAQNLEKNVEIIAFVSEKLPPQAINSKTQLMDKLTEFTLLSGDKIKVTYLDPINDSSAEELANSFGIPALDLQVVEKDQAQVIKAYFGLAVTTLAESSEIDSDNPLSKYQKQEVIPVIEDLNSLEFDLASSLLKVGADSLKTVAFLQGHGEHGFAMPQYLAAMNNDPRADYNVSEELNRNYTVTTIDLSTLDESQKQDPFAEVDTLIIAGPQTEIPEEEVTKIHQFIQSGGNAIMLIDSMKIDTQFNFNATRLPVSFDNLLKPWGISVRPVLIADSVNDMASFNQGYITYTLPYPFFTKVTNINTDNSITRDVETFSLPWVSPLDLNSNELAKIDILASSSDRYQIFAETEITVPAETEGESEVQFQPIDLNPQQNFNFNQTQNPLPLIVMAQSENSGKVIIAGESDFVAQGGSSLLLFYNMIDSLTLGDDLIEIRSKGVTDRPLKDLTSSQKDTIRWGITVGVPLLFVFYGFYHRHRRQQKKLTS